MPRSLYPWDGTPVPVEPEAVWATQTVWRFWTDFFLPLPAFEPRTVQPASSLVATPSTLTRFLLKDGYLLTPWCRVLPEQLPGLQLIKKFPAFHGTRRFITALTSVNHLSLSWASPIQSTCPHPTSWRSILILSTHQRLGLPSGLLPSGFPTKTLYTPLSSPIRIGYVLF